jgi:hypothetical protein
LREQTTLEENEVNLEKLRNKNSTTEEEREVCDENAGDMAS